jgi:hypothetical protein
MNEENEQKPIEAQTGPDDIIDTDSADARKDAVQEKLEGAEPAKDETDVNPEGAKLSRSE